MGFLLSLQALEGEHGDGHGAVGVSHVSSACNSSFSSVC